MNLASISWWQRTAPLAGALVACAVLAACAQPPAPPPPPAASQAPLPMPGSDVDPQGCKPSAGYRWCQRTARCERPWELAKQRGFDNTPEGWQRFCGAPAR
ncbi:hypothetical protein [Xenophilus sp.]|jgi:hypothetical protein|uniref:hypothetical protein n=1 Tax=Xenophilus sp. TaxID=1873499 RepID=UPI0037DDD808